MKCDNGRGRTPQDWAEHDFGIEGSQDIWIAIIGPDTPPLGDVANYPDAGPPIPGSLNGEQRPTARCATD